VVDVATAADWCRRGADWSSGTHATFSVYVDGSFAGNVSIHNIDTDHGTADIGYRVMALARGRGVATAAVREATAFAFEWLGLFRVQLLHAVPNVASCRVAAKAGYPLEATLRSAGSYAGKRLDEHLHAKLRTDPA
jgi:RimJ/RimL family protein N-acetyltransferase